MTPADDKTALDGDPVALCGPTDRAAWRAYATAALAAYLEHDRTNDGVARAIARSVKIADAMFVEELNRCTEGEVTRSADEAALVRKDPR